MGTGGGYKRYKCTVHTRGESSTRKEWRQCAETLFFNEQISISDIAQALNKSRKTITRYICSHPDYERAKQCRRIASADKRRRYQREWDTKNRKKYAELPGDRYGIITTETLKSEQALAAKILSLERFCKD